MILNSLTIPGHIIFEAGEGHRWQFDYENYKTDPKPDVLVLGTYKHPNTGNQLVGGINLHYISRRDQLDLRKLLPELSKIKGLKRRYRFGARALPHIFSDQAYRTYDSDHIADLETGVLFPVYGVLSKDPAKAQKAKANKAANIRSEPKVVDANKDIRNVEKAYERETINLANEVPSDKSVATPQDKEVVDRYAHIKDKDANLKNKEVVQLKAEKEYADTVDKAALKTAQNIAPLPAALSQAAPARELQTPAMPVSQAPERVKPAALQPAQPKPVAPVAAKPVLKSQASPVAQPDVIQKAPNIDYTKSANYDDRIENAPLDSEFEDLPIVDAMVVSPEAAITEAGNRFITFYSPRLRRYIIEEV